MSLSVINFQSDTAINAITDRQLLQSTTSARSGVINYADFALNTISLSTAVNVNSGYAVVKSTAQGSYFIWNDSTITLNINTNASGNPRIDTVYLQVRDNNWDSSGFTDARVLISQGNSTAGANMSNLLGAVLPSSGNFLIIGFVFVPVGGGNIVSAGAYIDPFVTSRGAAGGVDSTPQYAYGRPVGIVPAAAMSTAVTQVFNTSPFAVQYSGGSIIYDTWNTAIPAQSMANLSSAGISIKVPGTYLVSHYSSIPGTSPATSSWRLYIDNANNGQQVGNQTPSSADPNFWYGGSGVIRCGRGDFLQHKWEGTGTPTHGSSALHAVWKGI